MSRVTDRRRWLPQISARARILGWLLLVIAVALAASVLVTRSVLLARVDHDADVELAHEAVKLRDFAATARYPTVGDLLRGYLQATVAEEQEAFFSIVDGRPDRRSAGDPPARLDKDPAFVGSVATARTPRYGTIDTTGGPARYAVLPVRVAGQASTGALVVVEFTAERRAFAESVVRVLLGVGSATLLLAGGVGWLIAGRVLAPVRAVRSTAERISETDLSRRIEVEGTDDVAALARTVNHMLDRLERAFATQRTFLDDAGHELRTPITVIRGHLELLGDDPAERHATIALVTDELDRMRRIVDDLLTLAQSERPDFLRPGPTDLTDLTVDALAKASALGPRRWELGQVAEGTITADAQRLTQALMQLAANAVAHTDEGDRIEIGSAARPGETTLWVGDTGRGIPQSDQERIFERFARGTERHGAGLGLAIVRSIVQTHGGTVTVASEPGHGATFTMHLPLEARP